MNIWSKWIIKQKPLTSIPILLLSALFFTLAVGMFVTASHIFPKGISAYVQLVIYVLKLDKKWFSVILLVFNLPLCIIFWKSLGKKFVLYTLFWLVCQLGWAWMIYSFKINIDPFDFGYDHDGHIIASGRIVYGLIGAIFIATSTGFNFLAGGSGGGIDFFVYYYYLKYKKSVGFYSMLFGIFTVITSIVIQYALGKAVEKDMYHLFFGVTTFVTALYIVTYSFVISYIYPRHKRIKVEIYSKEYKKLSKYLASSKFHHGFSSRHEYSEYTQKNVEVITTVISYMELHRFIYIVKKIDPTSWISIVDVKQVYGNFSEKLIDY